MTEKKAATQPEAAIPPDSAEPQITASGRGPKPPKSVGWRHQDGCTNPVSDDWNCACGPEVITPD